jgi:hypothetical protein
MSHCEYLRFERIKIYTYLSCCMLFFLGYIFFSVFFFLLLTSHTEFAFEQIFLADVKFQNQNCAHTHTRTHAHTRVIINLPPRRVEVVNACSGRQAHAWTSHRSSSLPHIHLFFWFRKTLYLVFFFFSAFSSFQFSVCHRDLCPVSPGTHTQPTITLRWALRCVHSFRIRGESVL